MPNGARCRNRWPAQMDEHTKKLIDSGSVAKGILRWLTAHSPHETVTFVDRINAFISRVAMFLTAVAVIVTFYEVTMRYVFFSPTLWVNELTLWMGSVIFLVAGVYAMQRRSHIRITAAYDLFPEPVKYVCDIVSALVVVAYATLMIGASFGTAWETLVSWERFGTFWNPPIPATVKPLVLIATFLVAVQAVNNLYVDTIMHRKRKNTPRGTV